MDVIDCRKHYGLCYSLSSGGVGAIFNDESTALLGPEELLYRGTSSSGWEVLSLSTAKEVLSKKYKLMKSFRSLLAQRRIAFTLEASPAEPCCLSLD